MAPRTKPMTPLSHITLRVSFKTKFDKTLQPHRCTSTSLMYSRIAAYTNSTPRSATIFLYEVYERPRHKLGITLFLSSHSAARVSPIHQSTSPKRLQRTQALSLRLSRHWRELKLRSPRLKRSVGTGAQQGSGADRQKSCGRSRPSKPLRCLPQNWKDSF